MNVAIVIGQRGWVWVGRYEAGLDEVTLNGAMCVRRWGTKNGLGELATNGPTKETVLDAPCTVRIHRLAIVGVLECNQKAWSKVIG